MFFKRPSLERGHSHLGWLDSYFSFSFADYYDPKYRGFSVLRVINEDRIQGGEGFPTHGHKDMEIITYIISGALEHKDTMGNSTVILPGDIQRMSAGSGVEHSEYNHHKDQLTHLLQIWLFPHVKGLKPSYEQKSFKKEFASQDLTLVLSQSGRLGSVRIHQDSEVYVAQLKADKKLEFPANPDRDYWLQVYKGQVVVNDEFILNSGDGLGVCKENHLLFFTTEGAEFLLFDLPPEKR